MDDDDEKKVDEDDGRYRFGLRTYSPSFFLCHRTEYSNEGRSMTLTQQSGPWGKQNYEKTSSQNSCVRETDSSSYAGKCR